jgi:elongator complex protein 3
MSKVDQSKVLVVGEIVQELCRSYDKGQTVSLQQIKQKIAKKYKMQSGPKLVEIIAAVPETHRAVLLPMLKAKPVRTASGIAVVGNFIC